MNLPSPAVAAPAAPQRTAASVRPASGRESPSGSDDFASLLQAAAAVPTEPGADAAEPGSGTGERLDAPPVAQPVPAVPVDGLPVPVPVPAAIASSPAADAPAPQALETAEPAAAPGTSPSAVPVPVAPQQVPAPDATGVATAAATTPLVATTVPPEQPVAPAPTSVAPVVGPAAAAPQQPATGGDPGTAHDGASSHHRQDGGAPAPESAAPVAAQQVPATSPPVTTAPATQDVVAPVVAPAPAPVAAAAAVSAPTTLTAPEAPQAPAPVVHAPVVATPAAQLAPRIGALRSLGEGVHRLVMRVQPEEIGAVRVVAEISADRVRIELHGGTEQAREALRAALPDLRRDLLQGSGFQLGSQHAASQDQRGSGPQAQLDLGGSGGGSYSGRGERPGTSSAPVAAPVELVLPRVAPGRLDVLT